MLYMLLTKKGIIKQKSPEMAGYNEPGAGSLLQGKTAFKHSSSNYCLVDMNILSHTLMI